MTAIIYHNPRCSKSRQTLQLLEEQGVNPEIIEYLKTPPSQEDLQIILESLNISARDLMRKNENIYKELKLDNPKLTEIELINTMIQHPVLIERPIVKIDNKVKIGRPPESVLDIL
jgi:arsenate reductase